jgi:hypothetical protein
MRSFLVVLAAAAALAACGSARPVWAPDADVARARYVHPGPPSVTLYTVMATGSSAGHHSGLMVNASERVVFNPAGEWFHPSLPERNDVHFGLTPRLLNYFIDYHTRETYDVIEQTVPVSPEVAELVMARAKAYGAVPKVQCAVAVSSVLRGVPGFEQVPATWLPRKIMESFATMPGVVSRTITEATSDKSHGVVLEKIEGRDPA